MMNRIYQRNDDGFSLADNALLFVILLYFTGGLFNLPIYNKYGYLLSWLLMLFGLIPIMGEWRRKPQGTFRILLTILTVRVLMYSYLALAITFGGEIYNFLWKPYDALVAASLYLFARRQLWNKD